jgi:hypothetical protein
LGEGDILEGHDANDIEVRLINGWDNVCLGRLSPSDHDKPKETMIKWVVKMFPEYHDKAMSLQENDNNCTHGMESRQAGKAFDVKNGNWHVTNLIRRNVPWSGRRGHVLG